MKNKLIDAAIERVLTRMIGRDGHKACVSEGRGGIVVWAEPEGQARRLGRFPWAP